MPDAAPSSRRLAAVCFADIVGYTTLSASDEERALALVRRLQEAAREEAAARGGRVVKFLGDAALAEFSSAEAAVGWGLAVAHSFQAADGGEEAVRLRVGVHLGETTVADDGDVYGDVVNVAARIQAAAEPGQVLVSDDVRRQLSRRPAFTFEDAGERILKGLEEPVPTWAVARRFAGRARPEDEAGAGASTREAGGRRLAVVPFRVLRADPDIDFLSFGLADGVACSLMGLRSLVVRSTASVQQHAGEGADPTSVARSAEVDLVLTGTLLRAGDKVRVSAQLVDGAGGDLLWSETATAPLGDLFELQDDLTRRIVDSLSVPLDGRQQERLARDVSHSGAAYELYLRGNQASVQESDWTKGVELYRASLEEDADYAPAWARLGRCYRLLGKYAGDSEGTEQGLARAEEAFGRALELSPDLPLAHSFLAQLEVERGRCVDGMTRLLRRIAESGPDVDHFVGLTHACRYCGLARASLAAHRRAVALDPRAATSVPFTHLAMAEYGKSLEAGDPHAFSSVHAFIFLGRSEEARRSLTAIRSGGTGTAIDRYTAALEAAADGDQDRAVRLGRQATEDFPDPEGTYLMGLHWVALGALEEGLDLVRASVDGGFYAVDNLRGDPHLDPVRSRPEFGATLEMAEAGRAAGLEAFRAQGGEEILGAAP